MDLRKKIVLLGTIQLIVVSVVLLVVYAREAKEKARQQFVEKSRSIILTAESTREEMGKKWDQGIFNAEQLKKWNEEGSKEKILAAVPVVTAWKAAMAKSEEGQYEFRVPKFQPRNSKNQPDELEARALEKMEKENLAEYYEIDEEKNAVRYFRPVKLTAECMYCHGDPAQSVVLWGNDQGLDPTGVKMENWKVGEVHGAFEVIQSLNQADAQLAASMWNAVYLLGGLAAIGCIVFYIFSCRGINGLYLPIRQLASQINESADQVADAAVQVSAASSQLADGNSKQAASLEETSAALEELAAMTRTNAENAQQANTLGVQSRAAANEGEQTMAQLDVAMKAITSSSEKINKIIKVIEEIAFQTNLLALNASVEAARAGEHGRGFAVVADEVRNLAQRAATAAREIAELISDSVNKTNDGSQVAAEAAKSLSNIVININQMSDLIEGISRASNEQSSGIDQINTAVSEIDQVTQANAANSEQSASASEEMASQAQSVKAMLNDLVALVGGGRE
ncbi:MAG: hypothetical protein HJJLKODD_01230 [Phycisphaerae bacterium]|nr:hypothetical protein [Phycisphaerae bacterium]